jgi:ATP-dependent exoDNAse (exonuclease V) beta subunit (contains helicase and exonuclease domains)
VVTILSSDTDLHLPNFTVVSASAGSGKTHTLTLKLLQLLLSPLIPNNRLNNVLAMTFTKNAAAEMRQRVLEYLKRAYFGDDTILSQIADVVTMEKEQLSAKAGELIDAILCDYSAFQIQTIDSFVARVFRASALEFGYSPTIEILLDSRPVLDAAFEQFVRELSTEPAKKRLLEELTARLVDSQSQARYIWNPFRKLSQEVRELYGTLSAQSKDVLLPEDESARAQDLQKELLATFQQLLKLVRQSGLETSSLFENVVAAADAFDIDKLISLKSIEKPLKAGKTKAEKEKVEHWNVQFEPHLEKFRALKIEYIRSSAEQYYRPAVEAHRLFRKDIEQSMRRTNQIYLPDVNRALLSYISQEIVPQVYFYLGEAIAHYLIDEFQDTSRVQWDALKPLLEETLSKGGSLFIVGDTKQSIYAFRHADWHIMKQVMKTTVFPSAPPQVKDLSVNYRSRERIVEFSTTVFHEIVPTHFTNDAPNASGLSTFRQEVQENSRGKGYVEVVSFEPNDELLPERTRLLEIIANCRTRGYEFGDITILTPKNRDVVEVSGWLNTAQIPFVPHSSLDIRSRRITGDLFALMRFLDSPIDDLAFASFILSKTFIRIVGARSEPPGEKDLHVFVLEARQNVRSVPLYIVFRERYPTLWQRYFEQLFTVVGYLPLYDLATEIFKRFQLFSLVSEEEGTLAKLLEVIKNFEDLGQNNLKDFLMFVEEESDNNSWNIILPRGAAAVEVMTIHKAKGLGNRVVLVLLYDTKKNPSSRILKEEADGIRLLHITKKEAESLEEFRQLYDENRLTHDVDDLNKLYVAFTRAREEMYVLSVKSEKYDEPSKFLPQKGYEQTTKPNVEKKDSILTPQAEIRFATRSISMDTTSTEKLAVYERQRGDRIHAILSQIEFVDEYIEDSLHILIEKQAEITAADADILRLQNTLAGFLSTPEILSWFTPQAGRIILNEQEFVSADGGLFRMDRIVVDVNTVTVIDFKTGDNKEGYTEQVQKYMNILKGYYPKRSIQGILAFVDRKNIRMIV